MCVRMHVLLYAYIQYMYIIYIKYEKCLFIYFSKYLLQLLIILILLCSILHYVSHTILLLIIKISIFLSEKIMRKDGSYRVVCQQQL